jgi:hypothetical protein
MVFETLAIRKEGVAFFVEIAAPVMNHDFSPNAGRLDVIHRF